MTTLEMQQLMDFILAQRVQFMITMRRVEENQAQMAQLQMRLSNTMRQLTEAQTRAAAIAAIIDPAKANNRSATWLAET